MARPSKLYVVKRNGESLQCYEDGVYLGSIPIKNLCLMLSSYKDKGTNE